MERKMFGHRLKRRSDSERTPGKPVHNMNNKSGMAKDNPPDYEGKEHVRYKNPGYSKHDIRYPQDEPHMRSHVHREVEHEMEDNYHMGVPDQTKHTLPDKIKRAHMLMDAPNQQDPKPLRGNIVHNVPYEGEEDTSGEEEMGPNDMQENDMPKEIRKKLIVAVVKKKMKKHNDEDESEEEGEEEEEGEDEVREKKRMRAMKSSY